MGGTLNLPYTKIFRSNCLLSVNAKTHCEYYIYDW